MLIIDSQLLYSNEELNKIKEIIINEKITYILIIVKLNMYVLMIIQKQNIFYKKI